MKSARTARIPTSGTVGVIASKEELLIGQRLQAPPDFFELRLDRLVSLQERDIAKLKSPIAGLFVQGSDGRGAIDMPLHEMPSQSRSGRERSLQIDGAATLECSQIRAGNRFLEQIEG